MISVFDCNSLISFQYITLIYKAQVIFLIFRIVIFLIFRIVFVNMVGILYNRKDGRINK
jgi:hypothetical protein